MKSILLIVLSGLSMCAQSIDLSALNAKFHFVQLAVVGSETGQPMETRSIGGDIVFDGAGAYRLSAHCGRGSEAATPCDATGVYAVSEAGAIMLTSPANPDLKMNARLG